jgi:hypothetical protein
MPAALDLLDHLLAPTDVVRLRGVVPKSLLVAPPNEFPVQP